MKLGVLFSGGKDSYLALQYSSQDHEISCLITLFPENKDSWMFHTPTIEWTKLQAQSMGFNHIIQSTKGVKEDELVDLKAVIQYSKKEYGIEGIVTGALASVYQATRIQMICFDLNLWCFNPLWQLSQTFLLHNLLSSNIESIITGVAAEPFDDSWLGRSIDLDCVSDLVKLQESYSINPAGEGGEFESFVINAPLFRNPIKISESKRHYSNFSGRLEIKEAYLG